MPTQDVDKRIAAIEAELPAPLPESYRSWLAGARGEPGWLGPWDSAWERVVRGFLREWNPLRGRLFPVEHLGDGVFACLHLGDARGEQRVIGWDIALDLAEQPLLLLGDDWQSYREGRRSGDLDPLEDIEAAAHECRATAAEDLARQVAAFERSVEAFHGDYSRKHQRRTFEHHADNAVPRRSEWRPERFAVQDILLAVMTYRYNPRLNYIDVVGFATRDHTNFARGSSTACLLVGLLCEWAQQGAEGVRFLRELPTSGSEDGDPAPVPREIAVLGVLLGVEISPDEPVITEGACRALLRESTPFPRRGRSRLAAVVPGIERACLAVHRGIWSPLEVALLLESCPDATTLFAGNVEPGEQVRFLSTLQHARSALLAGFGARVIETESARQEAPAPGVELLSHPYVALCRAEVPTEWRRADTGGVLRVEAGCPIALVGLGGLPGVPHGEVIGRLAEARSALATALPASCQILGVVPDRTSVNANAFQLVLADADEAALDASIQKRMGESRRLRL